MNDTLLLGIGNEKTVSILKDPFLKDKVNAIHVHMISVFSGKVSITGSVEFKNGETDGKQNFKGESFDDVVLQIKTFIQLLK